MDWGQRQLFLENIEERSTDVEVGYGNTDLNTFTIENEPELG